MNQSISDVAAPPRGATYVGIILVIAAAALWSLNGALIKLLRVDGQGPDGVTIAFYRSLIAGVVLWPLARGRWRSLLSDGTSDARGSRRLLLRPAALWCMVFFTLMTASFVVALTMTAAANVIILQYTSTFWVFGLSPMLLGEKARASDRWFLGIAAVGIGIIFAGNAEADLVGLAIALASGLFYAMLTLLIRRLRDADPAALTVFNNLGAAVLLLPIVLWSGDLSISARSAVYLAFMGVVQFGLPYYLYTLGLARVPAYQAALITMLEPVLVPIWAYLAVGEPVPLMTMIGGAVILATLALLVNASRGGRAPSGRESI